MRHVKGVEPRTSFIRLVAARIQITAIEVVQVSAYGWLLEAKGAI